jgi:hypothetical protein
MRELACATAGAFEEVGFDAVAALYLRKDYMLRARKQWERLAPSPALQRDILESIKLWNRSPRWQAENGRYIPKLANWLRNELWADAPGVVVPSVAVLKAREPDQVAAPIPEHVRKLRASFGRGKVQAPAINEASNKEEVEHAD